MLVCPRSRSVSGISLARFALTVTSG